MLSITACLPLRSQTAVCSRGTSSPCTGAGCPERRCSPEKVLSLGLNLLQLFLVHGLQDGLDHGGQAAVLAPDSVEQLTAVYRVSLHLATSSLVFLGTLVSVSSTCSPAKSCRGRD